MGASFSKQGFTSGYKESTPTTPVTPDNSQHGYEYNYYSDFQNLNANAIQNLSPEKVNPKLTNPNRVKLSQDQLGAISELNDKVYDYTQKPKDFGGSIRKGGGKRRRKTRKIRRRKSRSYNK